jgi:hypothetical protein
MLQTCIFRSTLPPGPCGKVIPGYHSFLENGNPKPGRMLKKSPSVVLASFRSSTYARGYASALHLLRPSWTNLLSILRESFPVVIRVRTTEALAYQCVFSHPAYPSVYSPIRTSNPRSLQSSNVQWKAAMTMPRNNTLRPVAQPRCAIGSAELFITARIPSNT